MIRKRAAARREDGHSRGGPHRPRRGKSRSSYTESFAFGLLTFAVVAGLGLVSSIVIARLYGIETMGAYALAFAAVGICTTFSTMQEQSAVARKLGLLEPRDPRVTGLFVAVMAFSTSLSVVAAVITATVAAALFHGSIDRPDLVWPTIVLLVEYALISNTNWNLDFVLGSFRAGREMFRIRVMHATLYLATATALSFTFESVWGIVVAQVIAAVTSLGVRMALVRSYMRLRVETAAIRDGMRSLPSILGFGARLTPAQVADGVSSEAGTWILGLTSSLAAVGAWSRAWYLTQRLLEPTYRIIEILLPTLAERRAKGDAEGYDRAIVQSARVVAIGLLVPAAVAGGAADGVLDLYGPGFDQAATALSMLLLIPPLYCVIQVMTQALLVEGRPLTISKLSIWRATVILGLAFPLSSWLGVDGLGLALLIGFVIDASLRVALTRRHLRAGRVFARPGRTLLAAAAAYAAGFVVARALDVALPGVLGLGAAVAGGSAAFVAAYVVCGGVTDHDRRLLATARAKLSGGGAR